jgi:hypothetical protein
MPVTHREVCEYLLKCQGSGDLSSATDSEIAERMVAFGHANPTNPAVVWLGYSPRDRRQEVSWNRVTGIDVSRIVSKGLNPAWQRALEAVGGNACRFVRECRSVYGDDYNETRLPSAELALIIGMVHPAKPNEVELIDGSHRLASMILNQFSTVDGYLGSY